MERIRTAHQARQRYADEVARQRADLKRLLKQCLHEECSEAVMQECTIKAHPHVAAIDSAHAGCTRCEEQAYQEHAWPDAGEVQVMAEVDDLLFRVRWCNSNYHLEVALS